MFENFGKTQDNREVKINRSGNTITVGQRIFDGYTQAADGQFFLYASVKSRRGGKVFEDIDSAARYLRDVGHKFTAKWSGFPS